MEAAAIAAVGGKLVLAELKKWATKRGARMGEWRGKLVCESIGKDWWRVGQDDADPCRLWIPAVGLEYSWGGGGWESDGPSIPWAACRILDCTRETFLKSGFLHDFGFRTETLFVRKPGGKWVRVKVTKRQCDIILRVGVNAEGATEGQEAAIYLGVKTCFAMAAWKKWRAQDASRLTTKGQTMITTETMDFGEAIRSLKQGRKVARKGWNGKGMYIFLADEGGDFHTKAEIGPERKAGVHPFIVMYTAQGDFQPGWLASQADMLAEDWAVVD